MASLQTLLRRNLSADQLELLRPSHRATRRIFDGGAFQFLQDQCLQVSPPAVYRDVLIKEEGSTSMQAFIKGKSL